MNELKVNFENLTEEERAELLKLVEKANKPKNKVWKPEDREEYYFIWGRGITDGVWSGWNIDENKYAIGNCFKTREEAQNAVERLKIRAELQRYADEHNEPIDWKNNNQEKWYIYFDYDDKRFVYMWKSFTRNCFQIYFSSEEIARAAVQAVGEERIKKYLFGVE